MTTNALTQTQTLAEVSQSCAGCFPQAGHLRSSEDR